MRERIIVAVLCLCAAAQADTLVLRGGRTVEGSYLGGSPREIKIAVDDRVETFPVNDVVELRFGASSATPSGVRPRPGAALTPGAKPQRREIMRPETTSAPRPRSMVEIPTGTSVVIRMIDDIDSERDRAGQTFRASLDEPIMVDGRAVAERGADVTVKLVENQESGKLTGRTELTLDLVAVQIGNRMVDIMTQEVSTQSESRTGQTAARSGGLAAAGAVIGAIAGGGKGAAIGAVTGAATGGAIQVMTKGPRVRVPSEARLTFTIQQPVRL